MESTECGAACLGMILAYHGRRMSLEKLRVLCGVSRDGSKATRVLRAARECGLIAGGFHSEPHQLFDLPFPLIVFWNFDHFLVVEGIRKDRVWVVDPASGPRRMSLQEFDRGFTGLCLAFAPGPEWRPGGRAPGAVRSLASRLGKTRSALWFALLATAALAVPGLAVATLIRVFIDSVLIPGDGAWVIPVLLGLALAAVVQAGLTWLQQTCLARIEIRLSVVMITRFIEHVVSLPMAFFGQRFIGDITARIGSNDRVARLLSGELVGGAMGLLTMVLYAAAMLTYDAGLTLIAFGLALTNLAVLRGVSRTRENATRLMLKERGKVDGVALNGLGMIETIKAGGEEGLFFSRWSGLYANALAAQQDLTRVTGLLNVVPPLLLSLGAVAILGVGGLRVLDGGLSLGGLVAFLTLTTSFLAPVNRLVGLRREDAEAIRERHRGIRELAYYSLRLAVVAGGLVLALVVVSVLLGRLQMRRHREALKMQGVIDGMIFQMITGLAKLRVANAEPYVLARWAGLFARQRGATLRARRWAAAQLAFNGLFTPLASAVLLGVMWTSLLAGDESSSFGLAAFLVAFSAFGQLAAGVTGLIAAATAVIALVPLFERVKPLLEAEPESAGDRTDPGDLTGDIELRDVHFRYQTDGDDVLNGVSLRIRPGDYVAIVGPSGSGKSTIYRLLFGFERPASGAVLFDGHDLLNLDPETVRRHLGVVLQDGQVAADTILNNVAGSSRPTTDEIWDAVRAAGLEDDIRAMPMGLHTMLHEGGRGLSGGQRQRLLIARALARKPRILLLDEATSALDNHTQSVVQDSLGRLSITRIVIAHRLSTVRDVDRIYVLDRGRIAERGRYDELIARGGVFAELAKRQLV